MRIEAEFATLHVDSCGRMHECEAKLQSFIRIEAEFATLHRDSCDRMHERKGKWQPLMCIEAEFATLHRDWRGRTLGSQTERGSGVRSLCASSCSRL